jgi:hypothetical protein
MNLGIGNFLFASLFDKSLEITSEVFNDSLLADVAFDRKQREKELHRTASS